MENTSQNDDSMGKVDPQTLEHDFPQALLYGNRRYEHATDANSMSWLTEINYHKVDGRTDQFFLYRTNDDKSPEIILHTAQTAKQLQQRPIARKKCPWLYTEYLDLAELKLPVSFDVQYAQRVLGYDKMTEGDSLRFFNHMATTANNMPVDFWTVLTLWLRDEMNHRDGFAAAYDQIFGCDPELEARLAMEDSDFDQFETILSDPFTTLLALAYDEALTIAYYRHNMPIYREFGVSMASFVHRVSSDEGWHISKFLDLAVSNYPHRHNEAPSILTKVAHLDGKPYKRTFFFDRDPTVGTQFDLALKEKAIRIVLRALNQKTKKRTTGANTEVNHG